MVQRTFNSAVIASAYTGYVMIPEAEPALYDAVHPLNALLEQRAGLEDADPFDPSYRKVLMVEIERTFTGLPAFKKAVDAYFSAAGDQVTREQAWNDKIRDLAAMLVQDQTVDL